MTEVKATEAAQRLAEESGIDLASIEGTGADGNVKVEDVEEAIAAREAAAEETVSVVVNPKLDAAEYVAPDGRRFGRNSRENPEITASEYDELAGERIGNLQPIVKEN